MRYSELGFFCQMCSDKPQINDVKFYINEDGTILFVCRCEQCGAEDMVKTSTEELVAKFFKPEATIINHEPKYEM